MGEGGGGRRGGVEGSSKSICVRRFSPSALSRKLFRFHLSPFPPETPDTQATYGMFEKGRAIASVFKS